MVRFCDIPKVGSGGRKYLLWVDDTATEQTMWLEAGMAKTIWPTAYYVI